MGHCVCWELTVMMIMTMTLKPHGAQDDDYETDDTGSVTDATEHVHTRCPCCVSLEEKEEER